MSIQLNKDAVLGLGCAVFLAGAIGIGAMSESADTCAAPRLHRGDSVAETGESQPCTVVDPGDTHSGRPGMRFMEE